MPINLKSEILWQEEPNSILYTNVKPVCDLCGKKSERVIEFKVSEEDEGSRACFLSDRDCVRQTMSILFTQNPDIEYLWSREIEYKIIGKGGKKKVAVQREPIGLSKRYTVMKRDGFQCVLCGASGMESQLEIDHIIPVSAGGMNAMDNLRTLCFKCNRGKRDQIE
jgi:hypothetical protein